eukprot:8573473-Pyramimonas_sp.AAC.1
MEVLHQVSFRHCVNLTAAPLNAVEAARLILHGIVAADIDQQGDSEDDGQGVDEPPRSGNPDETSV